MRRTCCSRARASTRPPARCRSTAPRRAVASLQTKRSATSRICGRCDGVLGYSQGPAIRVLTYSQGSSDKGTRVAHRTSSDICERARRSHVPKRISAQGRERHRPRWSFVSSRLVSSLSRALGSRELRARVDCAPHRTGAAAGRRQAKETLCVPRGLMPEDVFWRHYFALVESTWAIPRVL